MKLRLLITVLLLTCGINNFADAMKRSRGENPAENSGSDHGGGSGAGAGAGGDGSGSGGGDSTKRLRTEAEAQTAGSCGICLSEYTPEDVTRTLACTHRFHTACINPWFTNHNTCPTCRTVEPGVVHVAPLAEEADIPEALRLLIAATTNGAISAADLTALLMQIPDVNQADEHGDIALIEAANNNQLMIVQALATVADINPNVHGTSGLSPLHYAIYQTGNNPAMAQALLAIHDIDVNIQDDDENTPLHTAIESNRMDIFHLLLAHPGINPNIPDANGKTALHLAVEAGNAAAVNALLNHEDLLINYQDNEGQTSLHLAVDAENRLLIIDLIRHGAAINIANDWYETVENDPYFQAIIKEVAAILFIGIATTANAHK